LLIKLASAQGHKQLEPPKTTKELATRAVKLESQSYRVTHKHKCKPTRASDIMIFLPMFDYLPAAYVLVEVDT
jgi:hypothetical protein